MSGCFWFQSQKWAPPKRAAGLDEELPCFWSHAIKMMALEAPLPTTAMVQEPEQFIPHHTVHKWMDWFYFRKVNALTKLGAMLAWIPKHGCNIPGLVFLQGHRPLMLLASWRCTLPLITGLSHDGNSQKYQEASAALLEVSISLPHPGQSTSLFMLLHQATEFPSKQSSIFFCFRVLR